MAWLKLLVGVTIGICFAFLTNFAIGQSSVTQATITSIFEGDQVFIQEKRSKVKDIVRMNQQVRTGAARAELTFNNSAVIRLGNNSQFTVGQCGVQLDKGTALISGTSACTPGVVAAVRGTTYLMTVKPDGEEEYKVLEGGVDFKKTDPNDRHQWGMNAGDSCIIKPSQRGTLRKKLSLREYTRILRGRLFRGYRGDPKRIERIQNAYASLYPGTKFPFRTGYKSPHRGHYTLAIRQNRPQLNDVIVRISWQKRRGDYLLPEKFVGDFVFPINQKARFIRGLQPDDRIALRLFDRQNRFLGYTEFEGLDENVAISVILPDQPELYGTLRTVFGDDIDRDSVIDRDAVSYDYYSQVKLPEDNKREKTEILFPRDAELITRSAFAVEGFPEPTIEQGFPDHFYDSLYSPIDRAVRPFSSNLDQKLIEVPGQEAPLTPIKPDGTSEFEVPKEILRYRGRFRRS